MLVFCFYIKKKQILFFVVCLNKGSQAQKHSYEWNLRTIRSYYNQTIYKLGSIKRNISALNVL